MSSLQLQDSDASAAWAACSRAQPNDAGGLEFLAVSYLISRALRFATRFSLVCASSQDQPPKRGRVDGVPPNETTGSGFIFPRASGPTRRRRRRNNRHMHESYVSTLDSQRRCDFGHDWWSGGTVPFCWYAYQFFFFLFPNVITAMFKE